MKTLTTDLGTDIAPVEIPGLGVFAAGTHEVEDDQVETYVALGGDWPEDQDSKEITMESLGYGVEEETTPDEEAPVEGEPGAPAEPESPPAEPAPEVPAEPSPEEAEGGDV